VSDPRDIKVGDTVRVAYWPCCPGAIGKWGTVSGFNKRPPDRDAGHCTHCGALHPDVEVVVVTSNGCYWPIQWVEKVPPLGELGITKEDEQLVIPTVPAEELT